MQDEMQLTLHKSLNLEIRLTREAAITRRTNLELLEAEEKIQIMEEENCAVKMEVFLSSMVGSDTLEGDLERMRNEVSELTACLRRVTKEGQQAKKTLLSEKEDLKMESEKMTVLRQLGTEKKMCASQIAGLKKKSQESQKELRDEISELQNAKKILLEEKDALKVELESEKQQIIVDAAAEKKLLTSQVSELKEILAQTQKELRSEMSELETRMRKMRCEKPAPKEEVKAGLEQEKGQQEPNAFSRFRARSRSRSRAQSRSRAESWSLLQSRRKDSSDVAAATEPQGKESSGPLGLRRVGERPKSHHSRSQKNGDDPPQKLWASVLKVARGKKGKDKRRNSRMMYEEASQSPSAQTLCIQPAVSGPDMSHVEVASSINKYLNQGDVVLFRFYAPTKSTAERYTFAPLRVPTPSKRIGTTLEDKFEEFRSMHSLTDSSDTFEQGADRFMEARKAWYLRQLATLQKESSEHAHIAIIRMVDRPEDVLCPPSLGDLCVIWNPHCGSEAMISVDERAQTSSPIVTKLLQHLAGSRILECYSKQRNASSTRQGEGEALDYNAVSKLLFRRAVVR
jgi:hypothetical protein